MVYTLTTGLKREYQIAVPRLEMNRLATRASNLRLWASKYGESPANKNNKIHFAGWKALT